MYDHDFAGKDDFMGRAAIDLSKFEPERTHNIEQVGLILMVIPNVFPELFRNLSQEGVDRVIWGELGHGVKMFLQA